ncbi:hypothetical protein B0181_04775 [Moraxella caviae]|uniref:Uncharacterized metalloprotease yggG n=1 Tax=Moraxella caviae TaxID=34060 RepID=A0A1T0A334_9GAMM|nr:M48 family metallopeptidase [Moraxella caviae]OOR90192.1 hypothetical protein B0181_04775 [Moraxella caviae]STZ14590.1 Uncharacterized metalloprotease yggG [Moraxella caviae]VEW11359.1 Uncharacterized metalloprotease yggG [Moraxella caviae]
MKKLLAVLAVSSALGLSGCAAYEEFMGIDRETINMSAKHLYSKYTNELEVDNTSQTSKRIRQVYQRILPYADKANNTGQKFDWELRVFRSDKVNAWALPGGRMGFYTGIVEKLDLTDDEIAAVMGHEMAHALEEHGKEKMSTEAAKQIFYTALAYTGVGALGYIAMATETGDLVMNSQSKEREADRVGLLLMAQAGYDPAAAITLWEKMRVHTKESRIVNGQRVVSVGDFISSHPSDKKRIEAMKKYQEAAMPYYQAALEGRAHEYVVPTNIKKTAKQKARELLGRE